MERKKLLKLPNLKDLYKKVYRYGGGGGGGGPPRPLKAIPEQDSSKPSSLSPSSLDSSDSLRAAAATTSSHNHHYYRNHEESGDEDERSWLRDLERERDRRALIRAAKKAHHLTKTNSTTKLNAPFQLPPIITNGNNNTSSPLSASTSSRGLPYTNGSGHSSTSDYSSLEEQSGSVENSEPYHNHFLNGGGPGGGGAMNFSSALALSDEYQSFRASVPLRRVAVDSNSTKTWKIYDAGPRKIVTPLIFLAPVSGTADIFYKQLLSLSSRGVRVIAAESPIYWSVNEWCEGFKALLDHLDLDKVHLFGASLGGFLAQKFSEYSFQYSRVASLILCNSFTDTSIFNLNESALVFWMLPALVLKKMVIGNLSSDRPDLPIAQTIEFMTERLDSLSQEEIASRLTINCVNSRVDTFKLRNVKMSLLDVFDDSALTSSTREQLYAAYPHAKLAALKTGGNFPYLSRAEEVNLHILVHLRAFNGTRLTAIQSQSAVGGEMMMENGVLGEEGVEEEEDDEVVDVARRS